MSSFPITIKTVNSTGGWTAVASTGSIDRDGEVLLPGAFNPIARTP